MTGCSGTTASPKPWADFLSQFDALEQLGELRLCRVGVDGHSSIAADVQVPYVLLHVIL